MFFCLRCVILASFWCAGISIFFPLLSFRPWSNTRCCYVEQKFLLWRNAPNLITLVLACHALSIVTLTCSIHHPPFFFPMPRCLTCSGKSNESRNLTFKLRRNSMHGIIILYHINGISLHNWFPPFKYEMMLYC